MAAQWIMDDKPGRGAVAWILDAATRWLHPSARRGVILLAVLAGMCAGIALPRPAAAWRHGRVFIRERGSPGYSAAWRPYPLPMPLYNYRYVMPPGAPLSYDDPESGKTYCWSQYSGAYFVCAYAPPPPLSGSLAPPMPPGAPAPIGEPAVGPASGLLMFRLPQGVEATVDGVPIALSEGVGVQALPPGQYRVVLQVSGRATEHTVNLRSHKIFTVTLGGIVATEP
jgi:hypothetical protein